MAQDILKAILAFLYFLRTSWHFKKHSTYIFSHYTSMSLAQLQDETYIQTYPQFCPLQWVQNCILLRPPLSLSSVFEYLHVLCINLEHILYSETLQSGISPNFLSPVYMCASKWVLKGCITQIEQMREWQYSMFHLYRNVNYLWMMIIAQIWIPSWCAEEELKNACFPLEEWFGKWHNVYAYELWKYVTIWHPRELRRSCLCISTL